MKNILTLLKELGIELTEDQKTGLQKGVEENYKPVTDWQKQEDKVKSLEEKVNTTEEALKKFEGVDPEKLNGEITSLKEALAQKDKEYQEKDAERNFNDLLKESISSAKGKNAKAITALLDMEALKASKNQKEDVAAALKALTEAEDSKMLFGEPEANPVGTGNIIGAITKPSGDTEDAAMRAAMGLPPVAEQK